ncbi:unnamed protein product [Alopecurus aequalis]
MNQLVAEEPRLELPPGFRFHPTDEEVVSHYLTPKVLDRFFSCLVIADVDLNKCEPWDLPSKAKMGEKEWYFFVHKDRKYPTGMRTNRATESGYWKATGKDREIFRGKGRASVLVGMKKTLVFHLGRAPRGEKTPWVMHEYRLDGKLPAHLPRSAKVTAGKNRSFFLSLFKSPCRRSIDRSIRWSAGPRTYARSHVALCPYLFTPLLMLLSTCCCVQDEWAVCRVFNKDLAAKNAPQAAPGAGGMERSDSLAFLEDLLDSVELPPLMDSPFDATDDDFTRASTSTSGAAVPQEPDMGYMVKREQPAQPQQMQSPYYFSYPATASGNPSGAGYSEYQTTGNQQDAIRRHCKPEAPLSPLLGSETEMPWLMPSSRQSSYLDLDDLCSEPLIDGLGPSMMYPTFLWGNSVS